MSESFHVSRNLLFVKGSLTQFVSSVTQNLLSLRILTVISPADALSEGKFFLTFVHRFHSSLRDMLERRYFVKLKFFLDFKNTMVI